MEGQRSERERREGGTGREIQRQSVCERERERDHGTNWSGPIVRHVLVRSMHGRALDASKHSPAQRGGP